MDLSQIKITFSASIQRVKNVNPAAPIGNISSPLFGKSVTLSTFRSASWNRTQRGPGNRHIGTAIAAHVLKK